VKIFSVVARFFRPRGTSPRPRDRKVLLWVALAALLPAGLGVIRLSAQTEEPTPEATPAPSPELPTPEIINEVAVIEETVTPVPSSQPATSEAASSAEPDLPPSPFGSAASVDSAPAPAVAPPTLAPPSEVEVAPALPPAPTPPLRTSDVAFPTPSGASTNEPLVMIGRPVERTNYGTGGNRRAMQLRSMPPETFTFDRAALRDVLRFLAEQAGIPYIGIPEHSPEAQKLVTFRMTASPFAALESLARQNDIKLTYDDGVWFMGLRDANIERVRQAESDNELIGVIYQLRHDPAEMVDFKGDGFSSEYTSAGGSSSFSASGESFGSGGSGNQGSFASSGAAPQSLPLQNSQLVFARRAPRIVNDIRVMLGLQPLQYRKDGTVVDPEAAGGAQVFRQPLPAFDGSLPLQPPASDTPAVGGLVAGAPFPAAPSTSPDAPAGAGTGGSQSDRLLPVYVPPQKPQVIYNSDTNILWVVATRKQHRWVADYLRRVDKPQDLIAIEVKFFETRKNPQTDFGINWQGTFGGEGLVLRGQGFADPSGLYSTESSRRSTSARQTEFGDVTVDTTGRTTVNARSLTTATPFSAVLSTSEVSVALQAFMADRQSSLVQYPRVLTINNREVAITSAENTPVNSGVQNVTSGTTGGQNVGSLEYIPVGTQINILPKAVGKKQIALTVAITISQIVDFVRLNLGTGENAYPVTTQRVYNASLQVDSGYTLAVGGLEKVADRNNTGGIPFLKDIPGVGYLFKNKNTSRDKSNLIIFITPYLISDPAETPGISEKPQTVLPLRPGVPPPAPKFTPEGSLVGGDDAVAEALAWVDFQLRYFRQTQVEGRTDENSVAQLRNVIAVARNLDSYLSARVEAGANYVYAPLFDQAEQARSLLLDLNRLLGASLTDEAEQTWLP